MDAKSISHQWGKNYWFRQFFWYFENGCGHWFYGCGCLFQNKIWTTSCGGTAFWQPKISKTLKCFCLPCVHELDVRIHFRKHWRKDRTGKFLAVKRGTNGQPVAKNPGIRPLYPMPIDNFRSPYVGIKRNKRPKEVKIDEKEIKEKESAQALWYGFSPVTWAQK